FLLLEFSWSFQVLAIFSATLVHAAIALDLGGMCFFFIIMCHLAARRQRYLPRRCVSLHLMKGKCNGISALLLKLVLHDIILLMSLNFYVKMHLGKKKKKKRKNEFDGPMHGVEVVSLG
ncbi:ELO family, partial [Trema orientale]